MSMGGFLARHSVSQVELAEALGVTPGAVNHKLAGRRGWSKPEIDTILVFLRARLGRRVTYEQVFGGPEPATGLVAGGGAAA